MVVWGAAALEYQVKGSMFMEVVMTDYEMITFEKQAGVAKIKLNRPEVMNALNKEMFIELGRALDEADRDDDVRVVVLGGKGRSFCAGEDLKLAGAEHNTALPSGSFTAWETARSVEKIENMDKPVIAAVHGYCLAGGFEILLACDLVVAAEDAVIADQHINIRAIGPGEARIGLPVWWG